MADLKNFDWQTDAKWFRFEEIASTSTFLKTYQAESDTPTYVIATAEYQTAGRGQRGNSWESERSKNLLFSIAHYAPPVASTHQFFISQLISCSILSVLNERYPEQKENFRIKWPNDIYWCERKLAGILIEHELTDSLIHRSIIGVGINVNQRAFHSDAPNPVSLIQITGKETKEPETLVQDIITNYASVMQKYPIDSHSLESLIASRYHSLLYRQGIKAFYRDAYGEFEAVLQDVQPDGMLRLRDTDNHLRHYAFKEVSYII